MGGHKGDPCIFLIIVINNKNPLSTSKREGLTVIKSGSLLLNVECQVLR